MLLLIALYLGLVIILPLALSAAVSYRTLPHGRGCPLCRHETLWLRARSLAAVNRAKRGDSLQKRWCVVCGWEGVVRMTGNDLIDAPISRPVAVEEIGFTGLRLESSSQEDATSALSVRRLDVDGRAWRVMLECWNVAERWYGRLLFVGPAGRRCADTVQPFKGESPDEVLGLARSVSERALQERVRTLMIAD